MTNFKDLVCKLGEAVAVDVPAESFVSAVSVPLFKLFKEFVSVAENRLAVRMPCAVNSLPRIYKCLCDVVLEGVKFFVILVLVSSLVGDP